MLLLHCVNLRLGASRRDMTTQGSGRRRSLPAVRDRVTKSDQSPVETYPFVVSAYEADHHQVCFGLFVAQLAIASHGTELTLRIPC